MGAGLNLSVDVRYQLQDWLPYGMWTTTDGREILFNFSYQPIWERSPDFFTRPADPEEFRGKYTRFKHTKFFYTPCGYDTPWLYKKALEKSARVLLDFGVSEELVHGHYLHVGFKCKVEIPERVWEMWREGHEFQRSQWEAKRTCSTEVRPPQP